MAAIELVSDRPTRTPFDPAFGVGARVVSRARQAGLIVRNRGDVVTLAPPFVISEGQIDELVSMLRRAVVDTLEALP